MELIIPLFQRLMKSFESVENALISSSFLIILFNCTQFFWFDWPCGLKMILFGRTSMKMQEVVVSISLLILSFYYKPVIGAMIFHLIQCTIRYSVIQPYGRYFKNLTPFSWFFSLNFLDAFRRFYSVQRWIDELSH